MLSQPNFKSVSTDGFHESGDGFGSALAAGDLDSDGVDDLAIGTPGEGEGYGTGSHAGAVYIAMGLPNASADLVQPFGVKFESHSSPWAEAGDDAGRALVIADVREKGEAQLVTGIPWGGTSGNDHGLVRVHSVDPAYGLDSNFQPVLLGYDVNLRQTLTQ